MQRRKKSDCGYIDYTCVGLPKLQQLFALNLDEIHAVHYKTDNDYEELKPVPVYSAETYNNFLNIPRVIQGPVKQAQIHQDLKKYKGPSDKSIGCSTQLDPFNDKGFQNLFESIAAFVEFKSADYYSQANATSTRLQKLNISDLDNIKLIKQTPGIIIPIRRPQDKIESIPNITIPNTVFPVGFNPSTISSSGGAIQPTWPSGCQSGTGVLIRRAGGKPQFVCLIQCF